MLVVGLVVWRSKRTGRRTVATGVVSWAAKEDEDEDVDTAAVV